MQLILGHALCYSLTYKDSKQDLDSDSRGKQRTKITHKKTLNTFDHVRSLLLQYCKDLWEFNAGPRGIMSHDPHTCSFG